MSLISATSKKRQKRFALLSLLLIVWAQAAIAGHNLQHSLVVPDNVCEVCVQLDRFGDAIPSEQSTGLVGSDHDQAAFRELFSVSNTPCHSFLSRAPPTS